MSIDTKQICMSVVAKLLIYTRKYFLSQLLVLHLIVEGYSKCMYPVISSKLGDGKTIGY